ncbi:hypothetical protein QQZ08_004032 [Neonectria magnoliae]|uniref:Uncharacterized protein n=1 Tax=Neonectria magnoliae TaxID=2732573 RepID=A0ABR1I8W4_9HYPO
MKRSDFGDELYRLGTAPPAELGFDVNPVKTVLHNGVVDLNPETGEVTSKDGSKDVGDVVIVQCNLAGGSNDSSSRVDDDLKTWDLQDLNPLPTFTKRRSILICDAAPAMSVLQGKGANMVVEDAESFRLLASNATKEEVPAVLRMINSVRRPRTARFSPTRVKWYEIPIEERLPKMDFNMNYSCIVDAMKSRGIVAE